MEFLLGALVVLVLAGTGLLLLLVLRRFLVLRAERRRARLIPRLRTIAAALIMDGEPPPPLSPVEEDLLAGVLWTFSRQITGAGREEIAAYFTKAGLIDRQIHELRARAGWRRARAAFLLGDAGSPRAIPGLLASLHDRHLPVRTAAARSLGRLHADESAGPVVRALAEERIPLIVAGSVLIELGASAAPALRTLLTEPDAQARVNGLALLGLLGTPDDTALITRRLADESAPVRAAAGRALGRLGSADAVSALLLGLADPDSRVRAGAAEGLGELQDETALPELLWRAEHDDFQPAAAAAAAAARIDGDAVVRIAAGPTPGPHLAEAASRVLTAQIRMTRR